MNVCHLFLVFLFFPVIIQCNDDSQTSKSGVSISINAPPSVALTKTFDENTLTSLVKSIIDFASNGFKNGLEASMRSMFKKPMTSAVYAISMLVGVVAMLAFYESPMPPLPDPPVGRFPPEHPIWPPRGQHGPHGHAQYQHKRVGLATPPVHGHLIPNAPFTHLWNSHRFDLKPVESKHSAQVLRNPERPVTPMNETSYHNYISKLTAASINGNNHNLEPLRKVYNTKAEVSNKVIDYSNKRMTVEALKYNTPNNQTLS